LECRHSLSSLFPSGVGEFSPFPPQLANHLRGNLWRKALYVTAAAAIAANSISGVQKWTNLQNFLSGSEFGNPDRMQNRKFVYDDCADSAAHSALWNSGFCLIHPRENRIDSFIDGQPGSIEPQANFGGF
jgi:hypothetical protein